jgi:hypothetical protein
MTILNLYNQLSSNYRFESKNVKTLKVIAEREREKGIFAVDGSLVKFVYFWKYLISTYLNDILSFSFSSTRISR